VLQVVEGCGGQRPHANPKIPISEAEQEDGHQLRKMTDVTTGNHVFLSSASKLYDQPREPQFDVWIWADTFERVANVDAEAAAAVFAGATV
jgi:hypothetical protein